MPNKASTFDKVKFTKDFQHREHLYKQLKDEAYYTLEKKLDASPIKYHSIPSRVKKLDSCVDKIEQHQFAEPFEQIQDFVGLRIICLFLSDIPGIGDLIRKNFIVLSSDDKVEAKDTTSFGYMSVHYIVRFGSKYKGDRYDLVKNIPFEIQVRTIAMDAWANISHHLDYKTEQDIPSELKRDFHALSGMFYVADKHFQLFFEQRHKKQKEIIETFKTGNKEEKFDQLINLDTMRAYLIDKFPDRRHASDPHISNLIDELTSAGYKTIGDLERLVDNGWEAFISFEKTGETGMLKGNKFVDVGVVRIIGKMLNANFHRISQKTFTIDSDLEKAFSEFQKKVAPYKHLLKQNK